MHSFFRSRAKLLLLSSLSLVATVLSAAPTIPFPQPSASSREQYVLELINAARANPAATGQMLASTKDPEILRNYTFFNVNTGQLVSDFSTYAPKPPLAFNAILMTSAQAHSAYMASAGVQSHNSADGTTFDKRVTSFGYQWSGLAENIYAGGTNPLFSFAGLIVDWGVPTLGHRMNILNLDGKAPTFREVGISCVDSPVKGFGPLVVTQDFGTPQDGGLAYVTGVVYQDLNGNGAYDEGEGLGGVTLTPDAGDFFAVSTAAGGYTIPLPKSGQGTLTLTANGGALASSQVKTVAYTAGTNAKLDFVTSVPALPTVTVSVPTADAQSGTQPGQLVVTRSGDLSTPLQVALKYAGAAKAGVDYKSLPGAVTIPAGQASMQMDVVPLAAGRATLLKLKVMALAGSGYKVVAKDNGKPIKAKLRIWPF